MRAPYPKRTELDNLFSDCLNSAHKANRFIMAKTCVVFCIPNMVIGGVEFVLIRTLAELVKQPDLEISVILSAPLTEPLFIEWFQAHPQIKTYVHMPLCHKFEALKDKCRVFPIKQIRKIAFSLYKKFRRARFRRHELIRNADVIIDYANFNYFKELKNVQKYKLTFVHGSINYFNNSGFYARTKYYDKIVVLSDSIKRDLAVQYPDIADKLVHIYNPINIDEIRTRAAQASAPNGKYFTCVSRLNYDKDIPTLIKAFEAFWAQEQHPDVKLYIVGDGPAMGDFQTRASETTAREQIVFCGKQSNPFGYMRGAMAHILSSYNEGLPTVLIEAAVNDTLNISSNCKSGPAEILMNGDAGILFEPGDADALAQIMSDVYHNRVNAKKMIKNAFLGLTRFSPEKITMQIIDLIKAK